jgi:hypothetical protein
VERRVLVTGSRNWNDWQTVWRELTRYIAEESAAIVDADGIPLDWARQGWVVVHGHCRTGADHWADRWANEHLVEVERHPADWSLGKSAGYRRNIEMVDAGAEVCLAFLNPCQKPLCQHLGLHYSHGTVHCMNQARKAGIEVREVYG